MSIGTTLRRLVEPHLTKFDTDPNSHYPRWVGCFEGTNHCNGKIDTLNEDWVFIMESDVINEGTITLYPTHRDCMVAEWGEDHVIPVKESPHRKFVTQLLTEGPAIGQTHL